MKNIPFCTYIPLSPPPSSIHLLPLRHLPQYKMTHQYYDKRSITVTWIWNDMNKPLNIRSTVKGQMSYIECIFKNPLVLQTLLWFLYGKYYEEIFRQTEDYLQQLFLHTWEKHGSHQYHSGLLTRLLEISWSWSELKSWPKEAYMAVSNFKWLEFSNYLEEHIGKSMLSLYSSRSNS